LFRHKSFPPDFAAAPYTYRLRFIRKFYQPVALNSVAAPESTFLTQFVLSFEQGFESPRPVMAHDYEKVPFAGYICLRILPNEL